MSAPTVRLNATEFTSAELAAGQVEYSHDDSESRHDAFHFVAMSSEAEDFMYAGTLHIDIVLKNDNAPVRAVDRVFRVVSGGERLLTGRFLRLVASSASRMHGFLTALSGSSSDTVSLPAGTRTPTWMHHRTRSPTVAGTSPMVAYTGLLNQAWPSSSSLRRI